MLRSRFVWIGLLLLLGSLNYYRNEMSPTLLLMPAGQSLEETFDKNFQDRNPDARHAITIRIYADQDATEDDVRQLADELWTFISQGKRRGIVGDQFSMAAAEGPTNVHEWFCITSDTASKDRWTDSLRAEEVMYRR